MAMQTDYIENLAVAALDACAHKGTDATPAETTLRERFYEILTLALGNLFPRMPTTGQIYDRAIFLRVTAGLEDGDAAALGKRTDDWMRLEGIIKQEEGKRAYYLPIKTQAALSTMTSKGLLGDVLAAVLKRYSESAPSEELRVATRNLGAAVLQLLQ